jgi:hypothetical protein
MSFQLEQMYRRDMHPLNEVKIQNGIFTTQKTAVQIWDMNVLGFQDEGYDETNLKPRLAALVGNTPSWSGNLV